MFKKEITLFDKAILCIIPFTIVLAIALLLITGNKNSEVKSLLIGASSAIILNYWHTKMTIKISQDNPKRLKRFTIFSYFIRYLLYGGIIVIGVFLSDFNPIYMIFGISEYPLMVLVLSLIMIKKE